MCFWSRSTIEYSTVRLIGRVHMAGTSYQRCGYGKWLPDPNHMSDGGGDILTGVGPKNAPNQTQSALLYWYSTACSCPLHCHITKERTMIVTPVTKLLKIRVYVYRLLLHSKFPN